MHCYTCHLDYNPGDKHFWNCDKKERDCEKCPSKELRELGERIAGDKRDKERVIGVFGDTTANVGIVEKYENRGKGIETKFYGNSFWFKGKLNKEMIDGGATLKAVLMESLILVKNLKLFFLLISPVFYIFHRQIIKELVFRFARVYEKDLKQKTLTNLEQFSPVTKELIRAGFKLAERIDNADTSFEYAGIWHEGEKDSQSYQVRIRRCIWAIATFIQADYAYYSRVQDGLASIREKSVKGLLDAFDTVMQRERQISLKVDQIRMAVKLLTLIPPIRNLINLYLQELDLEKFQPDDADKYYAYRRTCYDFEGKPFEERFAWAKERDKELGNVIIST